MEKQTLYEPGGFYHIFNHAIGKDDAFRNLDNYYYFLKKYGEKLDGVVQTYAYCLMPNHFHLLVKIREETVLLDFLAKKKEQDKKVYLPEGLNGPELCHFIVHRQFHNFLGGYSKAFNKAHDRVGNLFRQNTRRKIVEEEGYVMNAMRYLHLNAVHHGFTVLPEDWLHSSYHAYLGQQKTRLPREEVLAWFGGRENFIQFHRERMQIRLDEKLEG